MRRRSSLLLILVSFVLGLVAQRCLAQAPESSSAVGDRTHRVETKFTPIIIEQNEPPLSLDLAGLMKLFNVPPLALQSSTITKSLGQKATVSSERVDIHPSQRKHSFKRAPSANPLRQRQPCTLWKTASFPLMKT